MGHKFFLLFALVASTWAGSTLRTDSCSTRCTETKKFGYETGKTYEYDYTTDVDTTVQGAFEEKAGVQLTAKVSIDVVSKCEMNIRTDITGECKTAYTVSSNGWYSRTIKKSKDLIGCTDRHGYNTMMQGTPYKIQSEIQSLPLIKGSHECSQDISMAGILQSSVCEEEHVLRPFSRESSGAITKTKQTLKYVTERVSYSSSISIGHRVPLTFVHSNDGRGTIRDVMSKLNEICVSTSDSVKPDTPLFPLISSEDSEEAMLGVSSLVYAYCKKNECENDVDIASIVASIEDKIGVGCHVDKNNLGKVIRSLRSLGNAGFVSNSIRTISNCMTKRENPTEVRLSAIQAFRRMPCATSALMACPSDNVLSRVRNVLESEEVNQVGSYVWSHLTNLMETSSPLKQDIKNIINDQALKKEFDLEKQNIPETTKAPSSLRN
ncbi:unnamed protein product [Mytilus edulis]|uniref:Vitellogenin domain-containing protein n=1 Tax=Mytilus edulis TaxID=6550 RepID=A0A8S3S2M7_MYTED|nr:unnamed protein product [Mytilus edulis]